MRKTFLFLLVLLLTPLLWAATPVSNPAVMNFGESNYLSDASGHASINLGTQGGLNYSGSGPLSSPTGATGARINFTGMDTSKKYMWLRPKNASATITSTNSCGATLSVTRLSAYSNSTSTKPASITIGTSSTFAYYDHAGFSASVSLSGTPTKTCFFDGVLTGEIQYGEGKNTGQVTYSSMDLEMLLWTLVLSLEIPVVRLLSLIIVILLSIVVLHLPQALPLETNSRYPGWHLVPTIRLLYPPA